MHQTKPLSEMSLDEKIQWAAGYIALSIGQGKFLDCATKVILAVS